jgi:polyribonucleotide nucleotidyltransferase
MCCSVLTFLVQAAAPKKKKKTKKKKPAAEPEKPKAEEPKIKKGKAKAKPVKKAAAKPETQHHDESEYDGEWSTVTTKERPSTSKTVVIEDNDEELAAPKVVDQGTDIDLGSFKAAVIGKGGEVIKRLTAETGARFNISREDSTCNITGTPEQKQAGVAAVQAILDAETRYRAAMSFEDTIAVGTKVGAVVGKGGSTIKRIQSECGNVRLNIVTDEVTDEGTVHITGDEANVAKAKAMIEIIITGGM